MLKFNSSGLSYLYSSRPESEMWSWGSACKRNWYHDVL